MDDEEEDEDELEGIDDKADLEKDSRMSGMDGDSMNGDAEKS